MSCRVASFALLALLVAGISAVEIEPSFLPVREARNFVTATLFVTTTSKAVTTTTVTTKKVCASLAFGTVSSAAAAVATLAAAPASACRRKRNFYADDVYIGVPSNDDSPVQFYRLKPAEIMKFEPTLLPQFRQQPAPGKAPFIATPYVVEGSFEKQQGAPVDSRLFFGSQLSTLSSLVSAAVSNILTLTNTVTSTVTAYTSTATSYSYTATSSYYVVGACYPSGVTTC